MGTEAINNNQQRREESVRDRHVIAAHRNVKLSAYKHSALK